MAGGGGSELGARSASLLFLAGFHALRGSSSGEVLLIPHEPTMLPFRDPALWDTFGLKPTRPRLTLKSACVASIR